MSSGQHSPEIKKKCELIWLAISIYGKTKVLLLLVLKQSMIIPLGKSLTFGILHPVLCCHTFGLVCMLVPDLSCLWIAPYEPIQPVNKAAQMKVSSHSHKLISFW